MSILFLVSVSLSALGVVGLTRALIKFRQYPYSSGAAKKANRFRMLRRVSAAIVSQCRLASSSIGRRSYASQLEDNRAPNSWERFLQGGLAGASHARVQGQPDGTSRVRVSWEDGHESEFSTKWLRDHAAEAFNPHTKQREVSGETSTRENGENNGIGRAFS